MMGLAWQGSMTRFQYHIYYKRTSKCLPSAQLVPLLFTSTCSRPPSAFCCWLVTVCVWMDEEGGNRAVRDR